VECEMDERDLVGGGVGGGPKIVEVMRVTTKGSRSRESGGGGYDE